MTFRNALELRRLFPSGCLLFVILVLSALGCGDSKGLVPVEGVVLIEGAPMPGGKILLTPYGKGKPSAGMIQADGTFSLSTYSMNDGAKPGQHRVLVIDDTKIEENQPRITWEPPKDFVIEVAANEDNSLKIEVSSAAGWKQVADD
ncbi:MAG: hypothetical protein KDA57_04250 [Planctomycetales bacterium]|nr:hypothetical protein [Planctomycetales bacterium]